MSLSTTSERHFMVEKAYAFIGQSTGFLAITYVPNENWEPLKAHVTAHPCGNPTWSVYSLHRGPFTDMHDDVIKWKHSPRYWPFVRGIHRSLVISPHKGQWHGALIFSLICTWTISGDKRWRRRWFKMPSRSSWRHCNGINFNPSMDKCSAYTVKRRMNLLIYSQTLTVAPLKFGNG